MRIITTIPLARTIFDYVYGILHASGYRERFANDLTKDLPGTDGTGFHTCRGRARTRGTAPTKRFSALMVEYDAGPCRELISKGQCFPRYRYVDRSDTPCDLYDRPKRWSPSTTFRIRR